MELRRRRILALKVSGVFILSLVVAGLIAWSIQVELEEKANELKARLVSPDVSSCIESIRSKAYEFRLNSDVDLQKEVKKLEYTTYMYLAVILMAYLLTIYIFSYMIVGYLNRKINET